MDCQPSDSLIVQLRDADDDSGARMCQGLARGSESVPPFNLPGSIPAEEISSF